MNRRILAIWGLVLVMAVALIAQNQALASLSSPSGGRSGPAGKAKSPAHKAESTSQTHNDRPHRPIPGKSDIGQVSAIGGADPAASNMTSTSNQTASNNTAVAGNISNFNNQQ